MLSAIKLIYAVAVLAPAALAAAVDGSGGGATTSSIAISITTQPAITSSSITAQPITSSSPTTQPITTTTSSSPPAVTSFIGPLHANGGNKCLDVRGAVYADGTPVQIYDCNGTGAQTWIFTRGNTKVKVAGTNFCLDAGSAPASGVGMKIWTCFDNLPAQEWFYTDDNRIALTNQGQCLDVTNGVLVNANQVQTWQCTDNDINQIWTR